MNDKDFSQLLMVGVIGEELSAYEKAVFNRYPPGGVILFARNCVNPDKTRLLIDELQKISLAASGLPLVVAIDQEGGRVRRLQAGFPDFPGAAVLGVENDLSKTRLSTASLARALLHIGINCNLAPVADLFKEGSQVLFGRCFGSEPDLVGRQVAAYIESLQENGVAACVKHFPGHGTVVDDSHTMLPVSPLPRSELKPHLEPFIRAVNAGVKLMMAAHIKFPQIDSHTVPFSALFLQEIVRLELGFSGVLLSDDLDMAAVADRPLAEVMVAGIEAGLDMALWGRNLKPVTDPALVCADFCQQMRTHFSADSDCLQVKIARVRRLRQGFFQNG